MSALGRELEIHVMAEALGVGGKGDAAAAVVAFCRERIRGWLASRPALGSIAELEKLLLEKLRLVIHEVWTDADLEELRQKYIRLREFGFATLRDELQPGIFGTLFERLHVNGHSPDRFVAFIDCRTADKAARRFFTRWHEIAHVLTNFSQLELPLRRSRAKGSPTERMMDLLAGEFAFYSPLFTPLRRAELDREGLITFAGVERLRNEFCPAASFQATLNACIARAEFGAAYVEAELVHKKGEDPTASNRQPALFPIPSRPKHLRLTTVVPNDLARGMGLHVMLRVPGNSCVSEAFFEETQKAGNECLGNWSHSDGSTLRSCPVRVEARGFERHVFAVIQAA